MNSSSGNTRLAYNRTDLCRRTPFRSSAGTLPKPQSTIEGNNMKAQMNTDRLTQRELEALLKPRNEKHFARGMN